MRPAPGAQLPPIPTPSRTFAQPQTYGGRITAKRARTWRDERLQMDRALLGALDLARVRRVPDAVATWLRENAAAGAQRTAPAASSA